ncbi:hypothetical protein A3A39_04560 [Candidatus Kaiserbacteria bacterium RIFCSPLOWO2_01_FULL_54_13]|uniref:Uncharacterized protein n=1 Tax=Candidatus Kaiserbacteria bacterium RIFCSPLOWO2_01_FULL_54_13 TaxID=1798512 RepID=A0A1F6F1Q4_9BACT|nr:MAG: hypothetical protein A3A39_04560 [Candidatus Kaiserbacteria bacterium RIFCSPLOWO2_01_FULL_54_13]
MGELESNLQNPEKNKKSRLLSSIAKSRIAKTVRAGGALAMLYAAAPGIAQEAEAGPKERPVAVEKASSKIKSPESAKKPSPAEQLRQKKEVAERAAKRALEEKQAFEQLKLSDVPQVFLEKITAAKDGRSLSSVIGQKEFEGLNPDQQFSLLKYMNSSRFADQYDVYDNVLFRLMRLPLTEETRNFALEVAPHVKPRDKDDTSYTFGVQTYMASVLRKSSEDRTYRELARSNKDWSEKMILALAKNTPREGLMHNVVSQLYRHAPFMRGWGNNQIDVDDLIRKAYPLQSLPDIEKRYSQLVIYHDGKGNTRPDPKWFFLSSYWQYLLPEEKMTFVHKLLSKPSDETAQRKNDDVLQHMLIERNYWKDESREAYGRIIEEFAKADPNKLLRMYVRTGHSANWGEDLAGLKLALTDPRTHPQVRVNFIKLASIESSGTLAIRDELMKLVPPEELIVTRNKEPAAIKYENPFDRNLYRHTFGNANIFDDEALKNIREIRREDLPDDIQKLPPLETAQWQVMIARNLFFQNKKADQVAVRQEAERIREFREKYAEYPLFNHTTIASHEEIYKGRPRFGTAEFIEGVKKHASDTLHISPHLNRERGDYRVTRESLRNAKEKILQSIRTTQAPFTFFADMHGGGHDNGAIYLSDGQLPNTMEEKENGKGREDKRQPKETERTEKITAEEIAHAFVERYRDPRKLQMALSKPDVVILASCFSSNIVRSVAKILRDARMPIPVLIGMAEYGQVGFSQFYLKEGSDFARNTILQAEKNRPPTIGGIIDYTFQQRSSKPVVIVPDNNGNYMQLSDAEWFANVHTNVG